MHTSAVLALWFLLCLLVGGSGAARAAPGAEATDWEVVAADLLRQPGFKALPIRIVTSTGHAPAEMQIGGGRCVLHLRTRGNPVAELLLRQAAPEDRRVWMQAILVHEIAHCWRWQGQDAALQQFAALIGTAGRDSRRLDEVHQRMRDEETFADVAALAWVAQAAPAQFDAVLGAFERLRGNVTLSAGAHDTRAALDRVRREGFAPGLAPFDAARALLTDTGR
ncbi:hypothetical protein [uncultured Sphaerotilus sp.]|uniref:hypothetical protein n=1 Tax=uncultured Sphaerotilus sp. TaxID=474984 RepID=UPI0030CA5663